jgi:hypothetical protein
MQRNLTTTVADAPKQGRKLSPVVIGGAALVLAAAAGVATWQGIAQRDDARTTTTDAVVVQVTTPTAQPVSASPAAAMIRKILPFMSVPSVSH